MAPSSLSMPLPEHVPTPIGCQIGWQYPQHHASVLTIDEKGGHSYATYWSTGVYRCQFYRRSSHSYSLSAFAIGLHEFQSCGRSPCAKLTNGIAHARKIPRDGVVVHPGFVQPIMRMQKGAKWTEKMRHGLSRCFWNYSAVAKDKLGPLMKYFMEHSTLPPGTLIQKRCLAAKHNMSWRATRCTAVELYTVGKDRNQSAPIAGMLPTGV
jgi:hypothetical protein